MAANGHRVSFQANKNVLELVVLVAHLVTILKTAELYIKMVNLLVYELCLNKKKTTSLININAKIL